MARFGVGGLVLTCLLAQLLAMPVFGIAFQDLAQLSEFHNHALTPWPEVTLLRADPVAYVHTARTWLNERVYPVQWATRAQKTVLFRWFNEPPEPRISLGQDGHVFLNGGNNQTLFGLLTNACEYAHTESAARALRNASLYWSAQALRSAIATDLLVIPTAATVYADQLPRSTPVTLRQACLDRMEGRSALLLERTNGHNPPSFVYPLLEMLEAKHDPAFYPKANWHPVGLSLRVARNAYLANLGVIEFPADTLRLRNGPAEILLTYGIDWIRPFYVVDNSSVAPASNRNLDVRIRIAPLFRGSRFVTHAFQNSRPVLDQRVLMLSDSFGDAAAEVFAGAFRTLVHVNLNDQSAGRPSDVIEHVQQTGAVDRVIFLVQEGNAQQLAGWR